MPRQLRALDLFSGIGGFTLALHGLARTVAMCDIDPDSHAVLQGRMDDGLLDKCPIFKDVKKLQASDLPEPVDLIVSGFPCQDVSSLGLRRGIKGKRSGLVNEVFRLLDETAAKVLLIENVPNLVAKGMRYILSELVTKRGFNVTWAVVPASAVGAQHSRKRVFILARRPEFTHVFPAAQHLAFKWRAPPPRMVPAGQTATDHRCKRVQQLGNSVVPDAVRAAFITLVSGFAVTPAQVAASKTLLVKSFKEPDQARLKPVDSKAPLGMWGHATPKGTWTLVDPPAMRVPDLKLTFSPAVFDGERRQQPRPGVAPSPYVTTPVHARSWSTPRSVTSAARELTERMVRDLPTQVRFEVSTPDALRSGQISPYFVEWLMGYPKGWTRMPVGHRPGQIAGYRPNRKQRPAFEKAEW